MNRRKVFPVVQRSKIFVIEDHPLMCMGISQLLVANGFEVVGNAMSRAGVIAATKEVCPEVFLLDLVLENQEPGLPLISHLKTTFPDALVIVYSMHEDPQSIVSAMNAGADGFISKQESPAIIISALRSGNWSAPFLSPRIAQRAAPFLFQQARRKMNQPFSKREEEIYHYLGRGFRPREIAKALNISAKTVETYMHRLKQKLGLKSNLALARQAIEEFSQ